MTAPTAKNLLIQAAQVTLQLEHNNMKRSLNPVDLRTAHEKGQPTAIQAAEGAHFLQGHLERLKEGYDRGLRHLGLLPDSDASVPLGDVYTNPPRYGGLTAFGEAVIKECNRLGILIDLALANMETTEAALKVTTRPVIDSHTGLDTQLGSNPPMAEMMRPRLISKDQAKIVANAGGIVSVWTQLADKSLDYARNIRALVDVIPVEGLTPMVHLPVNSVRTLENAPTRRGKMKRPGSTTSLSTPC
jgi:membrane dipeptidase